MLGIPETLKRRFVCCLMLATLLTSLLPVSTLAQSQASSGQINGEILDSAGAAVPGATVTATNTQTGQERSVQTSKDGLYTIVLLPPGTYTVSVNASGFDSKTVTDIAVIVGRTIPINVKLGVGGLAEEVTVVAGAVEVQTTRNELDAVLNSTAIENLPINGRRFQDFVTLAPTAQVEPERQQISLAGQRGINSNINVDGSDYNNPFFGGIKGGERSNFAFTIPQESIREFQVIPAGYSAEFGRSTGGIVNAVTKSGTNEFHGSAFYFLRHKEFARSNEFFDTINEGDPEDPNDDTNFPFVPTQQQWGGSVGGPIKTDKIFFFGAYEQQRVRLSRQVDFGGLSDVIPTADTVEAFNHYRSLEVPFQATNDAIALLGRIDWQLSDNHRLNARYNYSRNEGENATNTGNAITPNTFRAVSNDGVEKDNTHTVVVQVTSIFSDRLVNEFRGQYAREERPREANSTDANVRTTFGEYGNRTFLPTTQDDNRIQLSDSLTYSRGDHTFKFGGEYNYVKATQTFGFNQFGSYDVRFSSDIPTVLEQLQVGGPNPNRFDRSGIRYFQQIGNLMAELPSHEFALFAQDSWRVRPNFTLNLGLRYEAQFNPDPIANNQDLLDVLRGVVFPVGYGVDPTTIDDQTKQFGPRAGFAWDPWSDGKTVIRGYGGIYYARTPLLLFADPINNFRIPPGNVTVTLPFSVGPGQPSTLYDQLFLIGIDLNTFPINQLPTISPDQITQLASALGLNPNPFQGASVTVAQPEFRNPRSYQAGVGFEREIMPGWVAGADFTYVNTVHLERNRDVNFPSTQLDPNDPARRPMFFVNGATRPVRDLFQVTVRESSARSLYRAFTVSSKFQRDWGQLNAFYTLAYNYSDDDNERSSGGNAYDDAYNLTPEYNFSNLDRRHQFVANPVFFLPYGFEVSSAIRLSSGTPVDARMGFDANRDSVFNDRPYSAPGVPFLRNAFRNYSTYDVDLRIQKRFNILEEQNLTFSVEMFNLFNADNITLSRSSTVVNYCSSPVPADCGFGAPTNPNFLQLRDSNPNSRNFGRLLTVNNPGTPFQVQLGLRYEF